MYTLCSEILDEAAISLHAEFDFFYDVFWGYVARAESKDDLSLRVMGKWHDLFGLPSNPVILE